MGVGAVTPTTVAYLTVAASSSTTVITVADNRADEYPQTTPFTCTITEQGHSETVTVTSRAAGSGRFVVTRGSPTYAYTTMAKLRYTGPELQYPEGGSMASTAQLDAAVLEAQERRVFIDEEVLEEFVRLVSQGEQDQAILLLWENLETSGG